MSDFMDLFGLKGISQVSQHNTDMLRNSFMLGMQRQETERLRQETEAAAIATAAAAAEQQRNSALLGGLGAIAGGSLGNWLGYTTPSQSYAAQSLGQMAGQSLAGGGINSFSPSDYASLATKEMEQGLDLQKEIYTQGELNQRNALGLAQSSAKATSDWQRQLLEKSYVAFATEAEAAAAGTAGTVQQIQAPDGTPAFVAYIPNAKAILEQKQAEATLKQTEVGLQQATQNLSKTESALLAEGAKVGSEAEIKAYWQALPADRKKIAPYLDPVTNKWVARALTPAEVAEARQRALANNLGLANLSQRKEEYNLSLTRFGFDRDVKIKEAYYQPVETPHFQKLVGAVDDLSSFENELDAYDAGDSGAIDRAIKSGLAKKVGGDSGALSDKDIANSGVSRSVINSMASKLQGLASGKSITASDLTAIRALVKAQKSARKGRVNSYIDRSAKLNEQTYGKAAGQLGIDLNESRKLLESFKYPTASTSRVNKIQSKLQSNSANLSLLPDYLTTREQPGKKLPLEKKGK